MMYIFTAAQIHNVKSSEILKPVVSFKQRAAGVRTEVLQKGGRGGGGGGGGRNYVQDSLLSLRYTKNNLLHVCLVYYSTPQKVL